MDSATDQVEKKENEEVTANGQTSVSLSNANEEKHDKVEDTTLSETKTEDKVEVGKTDDSQTVIVTPAQETIEQSCKIKPVELNSPIEPEPGVEVVKPEAEEREEQANTAVVVPEASEETVEEEQEPNAEVLKEIEISETGSQIVERPESIGGNPKTESEAEGVKETENSEVNSDNVPKPEPAVEQVKGKSKEDSEKGEEQESEGEEQESEVSVVTEGSSETAQKVIDAVEEKSREVVKETEEPEPAITEVEEKPREPEVKFEENEETVIPEETSEKPLDILEDDSARESDSQVVKETNKTDALPVEAEKPQVETEKPSEQSQVAQVEVEEKIKDLEEKPREVEQSQAEEESDAMGEGTSNTQVPASLKEGETQKEEEATVTNNSEAQVAAVEEDHKKESSHSDVVQDLSKDVVGASATTEQVTGEKESNVEEKVTANDGKESSREAVVETYKAGEQNDAKTGTTAEAGDKVESIKHEDRHQESKVEEVIGVVREPLASELQEKEESKLETQHVEDNVETQEPSTKKNDTIKTSKDLPRETPSKPAPAQKHSNNIISKVKQSLGKAKKAIIGKSPSSKTVSSNTHGDIKVK